MTIRLIIGAQDVVCDIKCISPLEIGSNGDVTWSVRLQAEPPGGPYLITATSGGQFIQLRNVMFGDVWFCSGQSNMAYSVSAVRMFRTLKSQLYRHCLQEEIAS